ncbi:MAG: hypothetical protein JRN53_07065 [Nitrososphaerota archaeon]|nr:hypothetical protein [Nitrososphaerota archaeon]
MGSTIKRILAEQQITYYRTDEEIVALLYTCARCGKKMYWRAGRTNIRYQGHEACVCDDCYKKLQVELAGEPRGDTVL